MEKSNKRCIWRVIGEDTSGPIYWCEFCGSIREDAGMSIPVIVDDDICIKDEYA